MNAARRVRTLAMIAIVGGLAVASCDGSGGGTAGQQQRTSAPPSAQQAKFGDPTAVDNPMFPLVPGTQFAYRGTVVEDGESKPHTVVFTVTDLTKMVGGVRTVVAIDRDFLEGKLQEQELALFAQDDNGNVWNFGEYPEEFENGKFTGAPSTWVKGVGGAYGGVHVLAKPAVGMRYVEGRVPAIDFHDVSRVARTGHRTCVHSGCYENVVVIDEWSPGDPAGGHQIKYYAPGTGLVRVGARGGDSQEYLSLLPVRHLSPQALARVRAVALNLDHRAYRISKVYRATGPAVMGQGG